MVTPAAASMQATDGPSPSAVPATVADPALAAEPTRADTPMLPAEPLLVPRDIPDTAVSSAMCLWAQDVDIPVDVARQAIRYVHANFASRLSQHPSADYTCLSKPLQELMVTAVRAITDDASFHILCVSEAQSDSSGADPASNSTLADGPSMPSASATGVAPAAPGGLNEPPLTPLFMSFNVSGLRERLQQLALFAVQQAEPWHVIALQETHHATQAVAAQWCREGPGPTAPWDGPSFWSAGTSASRGVALLLKACPLLSGVSAYAAQGN